MNTHTMFRPWKIALAACWCFAGLSYGQPIVRVSQVGFLPHEPKTAVVLSKTDIGSAECMIVDRNTRSTELKVPLWKLTETYGDYPYVYMLDFTPLDHEGYFVIDLAGSDSVLFQVSAKAFEDYLYEPLFYLRQQHCGYNAVFDTVCHQMDGIVVDGPGAGNRVDAVGGYHDASDYLRFLITTSYTTGILLLAHKEYPHLWIDVVDETGRKNSNKVPDVLDEARWGLEWMLKLNPEPGVLYHQVADDRDHMRLDLPFRDSSDYGWGIGRERPVYPATGGPQGLLEHKNTSTGLANIAGRSAAVFALASWIWSNGGYDKAFAQILRKKAEELYRLAVERQGASESVPCRAPYRFHEITFHDDLEWGAAELFRLTQKPEYLQEALRWASLAADTSWMGKDTARHYEYFPYVNLGHYELYEFAPPAMQDSLREYYRRGLERARKAGSQNAFGYGVPLIWVSNNLNLGLITQGLLYRKMGGGDEFVQFVRNSRDWMFGRNPWGRSFVVGVPDIGSTPQDIHSVVAKQMNMKLSGAVVDGPVYGSIYGALKGLHLTKPDLLAPYQSTWGVYHDDWGDYSTNEPTIDASAALVFVLAAYSRAK